MNGTGPSTPRVPTPGVWAPAVTFFNQSTDSLDLTAQKKYYTYLSHHLTGLVILGTNAETFLLTREERFQLLKTAREAVGPNYEIMAGVGGHSTKQVLEFVGDAAAAGADYVLVLPCAYFGAQTTKAVVKNFYAEVAAKSPLPIVVYNFPAVTNGLDLTSDDLHTLHKTHLNIVGVKLTCASVAKITRLASHFPATEFAVFGGQADFLIAGLTVGSAGTITGFGNVAPKLISKIYRLWKEGKVQEAMKLHGVQAEAEVIGRSGIANTKFGASLTSARAAGIEGAEGLLAPRRPYVELTGEEKEGIRKRLAEVVELENAL